MPRESRYTSQSAPWPRVITSNLLALSPSAWVKTLQWPPSKRANPFEVAAHSNPSSSTSKSLTLVRAATPGMSMGSNFSSAVELSGARLRKQPAVPATQSRCCLSIVTANT